MKGPFVDDEAFAKRLDEHDPLGRFRAEFAIPPRPNGEPSIYFNGNSLGLMPRKAGAYVEHEMDDWARLGVDGHFHGKTPWYTYHEVFRDSWARLVGAKPGEVVTMNSLTVNLHLMMAYAPNVITFPALPLDGTVSVSLQTQPFLKSAESPALYVAPFTSATASHGVASEPSPPAPAPQST